jgi:hypothetical protein
MKLRTAILVLALLHSWRESGFAVPQDSTSSAAHAVTGWSIRSEERDHYHPARLVAVGTVTVATVVGVHLYQQHAWWQGPRAPFRFENDWDYALNIDKLGHAYGAYLLSHLFGYGLRWSGIPQEHALLYGSLLGLGYQLYVEVEDGFHQEYGFSPGDAIADVAGASVPLLQETFPVLKSFALKWSYYPSREYLDALKQQQARVFIDDYEGQMYWYSWTPRAMFEGRSFSWFPGWLGVSVGFGARQLADPAQRHRIVAVTFDVNLARIHTGSAFFDAVLMALNHIHAPSPGFLVERGRVRFGVIY